MPIFWFDWRAKFAIRSKWASQWPGNFKVASRGLCKFMSRVPSLSSPFLLGFDEIERALDRVVKGADGYPPYNIETGDRSTGQPARLRITLAVAGFTRDQLDVTSDENKLVI